MALTFGEPDVERLKRSMTAKQLWGWLKYYRRHPWGEDRADLRAGIIAAASVAPWCKKGRRPKPADFIPKFVAPQKTPEQMWAVLMAGTKALEGMRRGQRQG